MNTCRILVILTACVLLTDIVSAQGYPNSIGCEQCGIFTLSKRRQCCNIGFIECCKVPVPSDETFPGDTSGGAYPGYLPRPIPEPELEPYPYQGGFYRPGRYPELNTGQYPPPSDYYPDGVYPPRVDPDSMADVILRKKPESTDDEDRKLPEPSTPGQVQKKEDPRKSRVGLIE